MDLEYFREYCLAKKETTESFPFDEVTLVFKVANKMFALASLDKDTERVNLKCDPERAILLRESYPDLIFPGYHMSKKHWNTIDIEQLSSDLILELIDHSYDQVVSKLTKKQKEEYGF